MKNVNVNINILIYITESKVDLHSFGKKEQNTQTHIYSVDIAARQAKMVSSMGQGQQRDFFYACPGEQECPKTYVKETKLRGSAKSKEQREG